MLRSLKIKDYMSKDLLVLSPEMEVLRAVHLLLKNRLSGAPVLDKHGRVVGIFTERDCMEEALKSLYHGEPGGLVGDHMRAKPDCVGSEQSVLTMAEMFIKGNFQRYPVIDNGRLVGVISRTDIMRALAEHYPS